MDTMTLTIYASSNLAVDQSASPTACAFTPKSRWQRLHTLGNKQAGVAF